MSQNHSPVELESFSVEGEKLQSTEKLEEERQNYQYPYTIKELQALQSWHAKGSEANFYKKVMIVIRAHSWLPEEDFRKLSGQKGGGYFYSELANEKLTEYFNLKSIGLSDKQYEEKIQTEKPCEVEVLEDDSNQNEVLDKHNLSVDDESPSSVTELVLNNGQTVEEAVNSLPALTQVEIPELEVTLPKKVDVVQGVQELFNIVKEKTEKSIEAANSERQKLSQVNQLVNGIQQMVQTKAQADHQKAQDSASLEQMEEHLTALQKMLGKQ